MPNPTILTNWSKSALSSCVLYQARDISGIGRALSIAREQRLSVIPHGAGHSYTDAALNSGGVVIDVTPMRRILSWDAALGIMRVEPGVTLGEMARAAWGDGWWPAVLPSTPVVTAGGSAAMNVNGRNAWKCGPFGDFILALEVLLVSGEVITLEAERDAQLLHAFVGGLGLLGIITSMTVQLQRINSGYVSVWKRPAGSIGDLVALFGEEAPRSDFMEGWLDGFATGKQLGRGHITCAALSPAGKFRPLPRPARPDYPWITLGARAAQPALLPGAPMVNRVNGWLSRGTAKSRRPLWPYTFWPPAAFAGYHAMLPQGVETFQAFVPAQHASEIFKQVLAYSQGHDCLPVWCVIKQHRSDPYLLSYQVDGFSLELNYPRTAGNAQALQQTLQRMIAMVIEAGGKFYLAKDHFLTHAQYRRSVGDAAIDAFLDLKSHYDPDGLLQSDLFRRVLQPV